MIKKNVIKEILVEEKQFEKNLESLIRETEEVKSKWLSGRKYLKNKNDIERTRKMTGELWESLESYRELPCLEELRRETVGLLYANEGMNRKHDFILVQISCVAALLSAVTINGQCADIFAHIAIIAALVVMVCISVKYLFKNDCKKRTFYKILKDQLDQILEERKKETRC